VVASIPSIFQQIVSILQAVEMHVHNRVSFKTQDTRSSAYLPSVRHVTVAAETTFFIHLILLCIVVILLFLLVPSACLPPPPGHPSGVGPQNLEAHESQGSGSRACAGEEVDSALTCGNCGWK
jgi:hypothetical protein